jgi:hypothetical protein
VSLVRALAQIDQEIAHVKERMNILAACIKALTPRRRRAA